MLDLFKILRITPLWHKIGVNRLLAGSYFVLANFAFHSADFSGNLIAIWPALGLALAVILVYGYQMVIGIAIGSLCFNLIYFTNSQATFPAALASSNIITLGKTRKGLIFSLLVPLRRVNFNELLCRTPI